jgi:NAD-specific glutamate dehydrogenase
MIDDVFALQADLAARVLSGADGEADPLAAWVLSRTAVLAPAEALVAELRSATIPDFAMLTVAARQLRQAVG